MTHALIGASVITFAIIYPAAGLIGWITAGFIDGDLEL